MLLQKKDKRKFYLDTVKIFESDSLHYIAEKHMGPRVVNKTKIRIRSWTPL